MTDRPRYQKIWNDIEQTVEMGGFQVDGCRDEENGNGSGSERGGNSEKLG